MERVPEAFGTDCDDEVGFVQLPAEPRHLTLPAHLQVLPQVQHHLNQTKSNLNDHFIGNFIFPNIQPLFGLSPSHLTVAEVLQEVGEALNDAGVLRTVSVGVTDEDFGAGPWTLRVHRCTVTGRLTALLIQLAVDVFYWTTLSVTETRSTTRL